MTFNINYIVGHRWQSKLPCASIYVKVHRPAGDFIYGQVAIPSVDGVLRENLRKRVTAIE